MSDRTAKPYWVDELGRKHECFGYDENRADHVRIEHDGRSFDLIVPKWARPFAVKVVAWKDDLLFLIGEQLDKEDEGGGIIEGGDGILIVARKREGFEDSYGTLIRHSLYPPSLEYIRAPKSGKSLE